MATHTLSIWPGLSVAHQEAVAGVEIQPPLPRSLIPAALELGFPKPQSIGTSPWSWLRSLGTLGWGGPEIESHSLFLHSFKK